jgi:1-acyl-sn-glycerol-3-phosphate acyltransferase
VLRALLSAITFVLFTIVGSVLAIPSALFDRSGDTVLRLARWWARAVLGSAGVTVRAHGYAALDPKQPYVVMPNHRSTMDIWAVLLAVPVPLRFIAKKQLGQIPLFGWAMKAGRFIFIDRQNNASARRSLEQAAARVREGVSVVIFPEGTRSTTGRLGPFKMGAFHLAIGSGAEVVPVAIRGSAALMPRGSARIYPGVVDIEIGTPIPTKGLGPDDRGALAEQVRAQVAAMLGEDAGPAADAAPFSKSPATG